MMITPYQKGAKNIKNAVGLLLIFIFCNRCSNGTSKHNPIEGKWKSLADNTMDFRLSFDENNLYSTDVQSKEVHFMVKGKYEIHQDTLFIRDTLNTPLVLCNYTDTGSYTFKKSHDTLFFKTIVDNCEKRKFVFEIGLVKIK